MSQQFWMITTEQLAMYTTRVCSLTTASVEIAAAKKSVYEQYKIKLPDRSTFKYLI